MGRPEGSGCYCYANNLVRGCIDSLSRGYQYVVMDNEAGLEHLSRRTTRNVQALLIVSDPSVRGIRTAGRLDELANELDIDVGERYLIVNRADDPLDPALQRAAEETGLTMLGTVPDDREIAQCDLEGTGLFDLPDTSPALIAVRDMVSRITVSAEIDRTHIARKKTQEERMAARIIDGKAIAERKRAKIAAQRRRAREARDHTRACRGHRRKRSRLRGLRAHEAQGL